MSNFWTLVHPTKNPPTHSELMGYFPPVFFPNNWVMTSPLFSSDRILIPSCRSCPTFCGASNFDSSNTLKIASGLSSAAILFIETFPQLTHSCTNINSPWRTTPYLSAPSCLKVNPIGLILNLHTDLLSPGFFRSTCFDHKQSTQWFRCSVPINSQKGTHRPQLQQLNPPLFCSETNNFDILFSSSLYIILLLNFVYQEIVHLSKPRNTLGELILD